MSIAQADQINELETKIKSLTAERDALKAKLEIAKDALEQIYAEAIGYPEINIPAFEALSQINKEVGE